MTGGSGGAPVAGAPGGGRRMPVTAWRIMRRGCTVSLVHFHGQPFLPATSQHKVREIASLLARQADGYLAYTEGGAENLRRIGMPDEKVWVVRNTIDVEAQTRLHEKYLQTDRAALRQQLGLKSDSVVLLYVGRLLPAVGLHGNHPQ